MEPEARVWGQGWAIVGSADEGLPSTLDHQFSTSFDLGLSETDVLLLSDGYVSE